MYKWIAAESEYIAVMESVQILSYNSLFVYNSVSATIHFFDDRVPNK